MTPTLRNSAPLFALLLLSLTTHASGQDGIPYGAACGVERWAIKTLMDSQAAALPTTPRDTTIGSILSLPAPENPLELPRRVRPFETTLWRVRARLMAYRTEEDSDVHLILADPSINRTLIGEIPAGYCTSSPKAPQFDQARAALEHIGNSPAKKRWYWLDDHYRRLPPIVIVTGYGFFDTEHARGAADNGAELHPILSVSTP